MYFVIGVDNNKKTHGFLHFGNHSDAMDYANTVIVSHGKQIDMELKPFDLASKGYKLSMITFLVENGIDEIRAVKEIEDALVSIQTNAIYELHSRRRK